MRTAKFIYFLLGIMLVSLPACETVIDSAPSPTESIDTTTYTFAETFKSSLGKFKQYSISGNQTWKSSQYQYVMMYGNTDDVSATNEDWLISPAITLPAGVTSVVTFDYVVRGFSDLANEATIWVSDDYVTDSLPTMATWKQLSTSEPMANSSGWNMVNAGDISLKTFAGKKVSIAFKYKSSNTQAGTWQIKNLYIKDKKPVTLPYSEPFLTTKGKFTTSNVSGNQFWYIDTHGYAYITGYVGSINNANEDWLISPQIDMTNVTTAKLTFEHVMRYFANPKTEATLWVSEDYEDGLPSTATWTQLTTVPFSDPGVWPTVFPTSREISLTAYAGKKISIAFKYISTATKAGTWEIKNFNVQEGEAVVEDFGKGTETIPYTVGGGIVYQGSNAWLKGYIVGYVVFGTPTNYVFSSDTCTVNSNLLVAASKTETDVNKCMAVQLPAGSVQTGLNLKSVKINIGKEVSLYGSLEAYFGKPGMKNTSYYVLEGGTTGGIKPIDYSAALLYESFATSLGTFTTQNVLGSQVWASTSFGATMTGFINPTNYENEDWLISSQVDLTNAPAANLSFDHVIRYCTDPKLDCTVCISEDYVAGLPSTATWTQLTTSTFVNASNWILTNTGAISLASYGGKKIKIALKYTSSNIKAGTWEIKNLVIFK